MTELLSLQILIVSRDKPLRDWIRQCAGSAPVPVGAVEADGAVAACTLLAAGIDLAFIDAALGPDEYAVVVHAARAARIPPFLVELGDAEGAAPPSECDGLAVKPTRFEDAKRLLESSIRIRVPSRILIVDDSPTMRSIVRKILVGTRFPLDVHEAGEGLAALKLLRGGGFDIVFLDYNLPDFNGFETLSEIKRERRRVSVVMMTSTPTDVLAERARELGASAFLKKPFYPADIDAVLCRFYGLRALNPNRR
jgi:CheY-like chemotaxis protein